MTFFFIGADSPAKVSSMSSIGSDAIAHPPSFSKLKRSSFPSKEFLSTLVLPARALLREYLEPPHSGEDQREHGRGQRGGICDDVSSDKALKKNSLFWFSTRGMRRKYVAFWN